MASEAYRNLKPEDLIGKRVLVKVYRGLWTGWTDVEERVVAEISPDRTYIRFAPLSALHHVGVDWKKVDNVRIESILDKETQGGKR